MRLSHNVGAYLKLFRVSVWPGSESEFIFVREFQTSSEDLNNKKLRAFEFENFGNKKGLSRSDTKINKLFLNLNSSSEVKIWER